jgi:hypothetical protein
MIIHPPKTPAFSGAYSEKRKERIRWERVEQQGGKQQRHRGAGPILRRQSRARAGKTHHILAVRDVASHICQQSQDVDAALAIGSPDIVDRIAPVTMSSTGKVRNNYSFATKYCSWHNPTKYPIWDARVNRYFLRLRCQNPSLPFPRPSGYLWDHYHEFLTLVTAFHDHYELGSLTFKQIDKFLYQEGGE